MREDKILTVPEIGKFFGVSRKTVYSWCRDGHLPAFKIGQEWMVRRSDLAKMINAKISKPGDLFSKDPAARPDARRGKQQ